MTFNENSPRKFPALSRESLLCADGQRRVGAWAAYTTSPCFDKNHICDFDPVIPNLRPVIERLGRTAARVLWSAAFRLHRPEEAPRKIERAINRLFCMFETYRRSIFRSAVSTMRVRQRADRWFPHRKIRSAGTILRPSVTATRRSRPGLLSKPAPARNPHDPASRSPPPGSRHRSPPGSASGPSVSTGCRSPPGGPRRS